MKMKNYHLFKFVEPGAKEQTVIIWELGTLNYWRKRPTKELESLKGWPEIPKMIKPPERYDTLDDAIKDIIVDII